KSVRTRRGNDALEMLSRVVMRRSSRDPVRTSGLLQIWLGCGRSFAVMTASVSHTAFTKAFIVSMVRCSPMPWITTTACMSGWVVPADAGCAAWGEPESLIGVQTNGMHRSLQGPRGIIERTMALQKSRSDHRTYRSARFRTGMIRHSRCQARSSCRASRYGNCGAKREGAICRRRSPITPSGHLWVRVDFPKGLARATRPPCSASTGFEPGEFRRDRRLLTQVKVIGKHDVAPSPRSTGTWSKGVSLTEARRPGRTPWPQCRRPRNHAFRPDAV